MNLSEQSDFYDSYWNDKTPFGAYKLTRIMWVLNCLKSLGSLRYDLRVLDMGCGDGRSVAIWNIFAKEAIGIDLSKGAMEAANLAYPLIDFYDGDACRTHFEDDSFDLIISHEVIEHIAIQSNYVGEIKRLLRKGGHLILTTPNRYYFDRRKGGNYSQQPIENVLTPKELKTLISPDFKIKTMTSMIIAKGDYGVYRLVTNSLLRRGLSRLKIKDYYDSILEKQLLGLHLGILCQLKDHK
jgi:SAM-dependent methyltransferase